MFDVAKILLPIDLSGHSLDVADAAAAVAEHFHPQIMVLHVLAPRLDEFLSTPSEKAAVHAFTRKQAEDQMKKVRFKAWRRLPVEHVLREGDPARMIVEFANSEHIDLIMMPTHGYGPFRRLLLGSVTAKVLHDAGCPVWTGVHSAVKPPHIKAQPTRIACAIDLGPHRGNVLMWASRLSWEFAAPLTVIHVADYDPRVGSGDQWPGRGEEMFAEARAKLTQLLQADGVSGEVQIEVGSIPAAVVERTRRIQADLLVIGRSGHGGAMGRLPTNAYAIIRDAPCPVLGV